MSYREDHEWAQAWQQRGDVEARNRLVTKHLKFAAAVARYQAGRKRLSIEDATQVGALGLMRAADTFDPSKANSFLTYAAPWVREEIAKYLFTETRLTSGGVHSKYRKRPELWRERHGSLPVAGHWVFPDGRIVPLADMLRGEDVDADVQLDHAEQLSLVTGALATLPEREQDIVMRRAQGETLDSICPHHNISRERVRQLEQRAYKRMRTWLEEKSA